MTAIIRFLFLTILLACCCTLSAHAQEVVAPVDHYPPWKFTEDRVEVVGIDIQLTRALLEEAGFTPRFLKRPWKRCLTMMESGEADLLSGVLRRPEREVYMHFVQPPYKSRTVKALYVRKGTVIDRYEDLQGLTIGTTLGAKYFQRFDEDDSLVKEEVKSDVINLRKLAVGRIDCFIATEETGDYLILEEGLGDRIEKATFRYAKPTEVYFAVSRKSWLMERLPELSEAVRRMVESGTVDRIIRESLKGK